jgi:hypothetical protein
MYDLVALLFGLALLGMLLSFINPSLVLRWGKVRTRSRALMWYGLFAIVFMIGGSILHEPPQQTEQVSPVSVQDGLREAEANREKITKQTEAGLTELAAKQPKHSPEQQVEQEKASVRRVIFDLVTMDKPGSDAAGFARSMAQATGKGVGLGDVYGAFKAAKIAANDSFSRLIQYSLPKGLPAAVHEKLDGAHTAFRRAAMLRGDIAETFMEWLDSRKPSLESAMQEKSGQVTLAMTKAIASLTGAMSAAGFSDDEVKAELVAMSGKDQADTEQVKRKGP